MDALINSLVAGLPAGAVLTCFCILNYSKLKDIQTRLDRMEGLYTDHLKFHAEMKQTR